MLVDVATPRDPIYADVSRFASRTYARELGAMIRADPDMFAYAKNATAVVGCFGIYFASQHKPLLIERYVPKAFERISDDPSVDRALCAEIGTRALIPAIGFRSVDISLALSACLLVHARARGIRYVGFTSNRTTRSLAKILDIQVIQLGEPDLSGQNEDFRENWRRFFRIRQYCFGFRLESVTGCHAALEQLESRSIHSADRRPLFG